MINLVNVTHGSVVAWRRAGIHSTRRVTGDGYVPDAGGYLPTLVGLSAELVPDVPGRPMANFMVSVKSQKVSGSAKQKIATEISDTALVSDMTGTVMAIVITGAAITSGDMAVFKRQGQRDMVAVLHEDDVKAGLLEAALIRVARQRRHFARKLGPRGGLSADQCRTERDHAYRYRRAAHAAALRAAAAARVAQ